MYMHMYMRRKGKSRELHVRRSMYQARKGGGVVKFEHGNPHFKLSILMHVRDTTIKLLSECSTMLEGLTE